MCVFELRSERCAQNLLLGNNFPGVRNTPNSMGSNTYHLVRSQGNIARHFDITVSYSTSYSEGSRSIHR